MHRSGVSLVAELLEEATLSGRLCERKDDGTAWSWNPWLLRGRMTERGTTGAGRPQITGVPRVHRSLELDGRGMAGSDIRLGQTRVGFNGIRTLTPQAMFYGSTAANGPKLFLHWTKSWLGRRPACWTSAKAKPKNRPMSGAGDRLSRRPSMSTSHRAAFDAHGDSSRRSFAIGVVPLHQRRHRSDAHAHGDGGLRGKWCFART